ncbi:hypothetical protein FHY52_31530, partial [Nocardia nova]|uniref:cation-transporting P-type ATPase n=1 Tax=Nocardia nova TaxID=37330 RepID=UPI0025C94AAE|nr:hypothetical protein [Nocardia nova]
MPLRRRSFRRPPKGPGFDRPRGRRSDYEDLLRHIPSERCRAMTRSSATRTLPEGLWSAEAARRLARDGANTVPRRPPPPWWR